MQTFLPYGFIYDPSKRTLPTRIEMFKRGVSQSLKCLDYKRLGKQRVEAMQIFNQITTGKGGYPHHPINKMWAHYTNALAYYHDQCIYHWIQRGYENNMETILDKFTVSEIYDNDVPIWYGSQKYHLSHRYALLQKYYDHYSQFGWGDIDDMHSEYVWSDFVDKLLFEDMDTITSKSVIFINHIFNPWRDNYELLKQ